MTVKVETENCDLAKFFARLRGTQKKFASFHAPLRVSLKSCSLISSEHIWLIVAMQSFFKGLIEKFILKNLIMADKKVQSQKRPQNAVVSTATPEAREETSNVAYNEASIRNNLTVLEYSRTLQAAAR